MRQLCASKSALLSWLQEATAPEAAVQQAPSDVADVATASPMSPTQGLVMSGPASARTLAGTNSKAFASSSRQAGVQAGGEASAARPAAPIAESSSARDQVRPRFLPAACFTLSITFLTEVHLRLLPISGLPTSSMQHIMLYV